MSAADQGRGAAIRAVLEAFAARVNGHRAVQKMLKEWTRNIHVAASDLDVTYTLVVVDGQVREIAAGPAGERHVALTAPAEVVAGIFEGRLNPFHEYAAGRLRFSGSPKDEMRLDAVVQLVWH